MRKNNYELKKQVIKARQEQKSFVWIERNLGVLRGTAYQWTKKNSEGTLYTDRRTAEHRSKKEDDHEFLKKCLALLEEIRSI